MESHKFPKRNITKMLLLPKLVSNPNEIFITIAVKLEVEGNQITDYKKEELLLKKKEGGTCAIIKSYYKPTVINNDVVLKQEMSNKHCKDAPFHVIFSE